ncbi:hypothetical protein OC835_008013, partial [Tilletia horrida]
MTAADKIHDQDQDQDLLTGQPPARVAVATSTPSESSSSEKLATITPDGKDIDTPLDPRQARLRKHSDIFTVLA